MGKKIIVESIWHPILFDSVQDPGKKYLIADGLWKEVEGEVTYQDIVWFKKESSQRKSTALSIEMDFDIPGSKGKNYKVRYSNNKWSCSCEAFTFSGGRSHCKHIKQTIKEVEEGKHSPKN